LQLRSEFRQAVLADPRGVVRLAHGIGLNSYTALSRLLYAPRVSATTLAQARLRALADLIEFKGEVFHE
jgi:hypothetical protein